MVERNLVNEVNLPEDSILVWRDIDLYLKHDFLTKSECDELISVSDGTYHPSRVVTTGADVERNENVRSSTTSKLTQDCANEGIVKRVDRMLCDIYGRDDLTSDHLQIHRYREGQQFQSHYDFSDEGRNAERIAQLGQRTWTMIVYLNDDFNGGDTRFDNIDINIYPSRGTLVMWNNLNADGSGNLATLHAGLPVTKGTKYLLSKWFRDKKRV